MRTGQEPDFEEWYGAQSAQNRYFWRERRKMMDLLAEAGRDRCGSIPNRANHSLLVNDGDVRVVQSLLKEISKTFPTQRDKKRSFSVNPGKVDGDCGTGTIKAIDNIQRWFFRGTDGCIDPGGTTIKARKIVKVSQIGLKGSHFLLIRRPDTP